MDIQPVSGLCVSVVLGDVVQRYGIEAMLRSTGVGSGAVHCFATSEEALAHADLPRSGLVVLAARETEHWPVSAVGDRVSHGARLLVMVDGTDDQDIARAAALCGQGFVDCRDLSAQALSAAAADVSRGKLYVSANLAVALLGKAGQTRSAAAEARGTSLTPRELQVLRLLAQGCSNKQVARRLAISEHGVKRLVSNILAKLNCLNRTMAVVRAMEEGLLAA